MRNQDAIFKLKHIHEQVKFTTAAKETLGISFLNYLTIISHYFSLFQELKRLNHENDRLTSLVVRLGGSTQLRNINSSTYNNTLNDPLLSVSRDESFAEASFHQANNNFAHSPGMRFGQPSPTSSTTKQASSKAPIYSSRIRESLTPPGKFQQRASSADAHTSSHRYGTTGGNARAEMESPPARPGARRDDQNTEVRSQQQQLQDRLAHSKRASFESGTRLSAKYAEPDTNSETTHSERPATGTAKSLRVPESPPPPAPKSMKSLLNWGALNESLAQQVIYEPLCPLFYLYLSIFSLSM